MRRPEPATRRLIVAGLLGAASVAAFAPLDWFVLAWLTHAGLFILLNREADAVDTRRRTRKGALIGGAFGFGLFITGVSWVYVSLSTFGGMPSALAALATLLFCTFLSLYPALAGALFVGHAPKRGWQRALLLAALLTLGEWLRGWIFTGFPWLAIGYSQTPPSPLAGYVPLFGVFGASLLTLFVGALLGESMRVLAATQASSRVSAAPPILLSVAVLAGGAWLSDIRWTTPQGSPVSVALLQGNVAQDLKWRPDKFIESLRTYYHLAQKNPAQLTVLPETALPAFLDNVPREYLDEIKKLAVRERGDLIFGIVVGNNENYANGAVSVGISPEQQYRKSHLVPFGEFIPPGFSWFLKLASIPMASFSPGTSPQTPMSLVEQQVAVNICYEDAFGEEIIRSLPAATLLVNISNVAWFGDSLAPAQHLQIARIRALETGRMMLRATNTGMTAIVDTRGNVQSVLPPFTRGALRGEVVGHTGATPYVRWGNWPAITFTLCISLLSLAVPGRRKEVS